MAYELEDKFKGCILGAAIGDAFGMPTECLNKQELEERYDGCVRDFVDPIAPHPNKHLKAGQYTDDTQQLLIIAESLLANKGFDINDIGKRIGEWGRKNFSDPTYERFPGNTSIHAAAKLADKIDPFKSGSEHTTSCGSAMRVAPIGLYFHKELDQVISYAKLSSIPTHNTEACKDGAALVALIVAHLARNEAPIDAVKKAAASIGHQELKEKTMQAVELANYNTDIAMEKLGTSSSVLDAVPFSVYCFLHRPTDFLNVMITAANAVPGDTDSFGCIAGAFSGTYLGSKKLPSNLVLRLEDSGKIKRMSEELYWTNPFV